MQIAQVRVSRTLRIAAGRRSKRIEVWNNVAVENWGGRKVDVGFTEDGEIGPTRFSSQLVCYVLPYSFIKHQNSDVTQALL